MKSSQKRAHRIEEELDDSARYAGKSAFPRFGGGA
mgnify:CR=1 FL=1